MTTPRSGDDDEAQGSHPDRADEPTDSATEAAEETTEPTEGAPAEHSSDSPTAGIDDNSMPQDLRDEMRGDADEGGADVPKM